MEEIMKPIFKQLIADFQEATLPEVTPRDVHFPELPSMVKKAYVLIGMRRSGKTWAMYQHIHALINSSVSKKHILYLDFSDDRLSSLTSHDLQDLLLAYYELNPEVSTDTKVYFFLDEIHEVDSWENFIRRLINTDSITVYLSGSSAKMLSKEIATTLRGRTIVREIFPFSFKEYLRHYEVHYSKNLSTHQKATMNHHLQKYLYYGGFPETLNLSENLYRELLQGYMDVVLYRDIIERYQVSNTLALKQFLNYCLQNSAKLLSVHKLYNIFKSLGYSVGKSSLYEYSTYLNDSYCLLTVPAYHFSLKKSSLKPKKIYPIDTGLITAYTIKSDYEESARLETAVFLQLRRKYSTIFYYRTASNKEIDFLVLENNQFFLYQVCLSLSDAKTKAREINALLEASKELPVEKAYVITLEDEYDEVVDSHTIHVMPLWKFLLS